MQKEGKPIWVESLMTKEEWKVRHKTFSTSSNLSEPPEEFECDFKWRWRMGKSLTQQEIKLINDRLAEVLKKVQK